MAISEARKQELLDAIAAYKAESASLSTSPSSGLTEERKAQLDAILANHKVEKVTTPAPSLAGSLASTLVESGQSFIEKETQRLETLGTAAKGVLTGQIPVTQAGNIVAGQIAGVVNDLAGEFVAGVGKTWYKQQSKETQEKIDGAVQGVLGTTIPGTDQTIQDSVAKLVETYQAWRERNPEEAVQAESVANLLSVVPLAGVEEAASAAARRAANEVILSAGGQVKRIGPGIGERIVEGTVVDAGTAAAQAATKTGKGVVSETIASAKRTIEAIPGRIEANRAAMEANRLILEPLPQVQRDAITNGVLPRDVRLVRELSPAEIAVARTMIDHAEQFGINRAAQDPAELVGREVTRRLDDLTTQARTQGEQLGTLVAEFPKRDLTKPVVPAVVKRLREVPGLKGLVVTENGELDFTRTVLASKLSKAEQRTVQSAFSDIFGMDAEQLHLYRQQLFDILQGKGKAGLILNGVEEKALNAIRQGAADVLDLTVKGYKALNQRNAELLGLIARYQKFFKGLSDAPGDIRDARGAVLARRLTSNAPSSQELANLFRETEDILRKYGIKYDVNINNLQDVLNAIERYFDITKDTGLAGQIRVGVEEAAPSIRGMIAGKAKEFAGQTKPVTQDAFKKLFQEGDVELPRDRVPEANKETNAPENAVPDNKDANESPHTVKTVPQEPKKKTPAKPTVKKETKKPVAKKPTSKPTPKKRSTKKAVSNVETSEQSLLSEAKKYKTAEEFVIAKTQPQDYAMSHRPSEGPRAFDLTEKVDGEQMIPKDMYEQWHGSRGDEFDKESIAVLRKIKGNPEANVTIYRASPKEAFEYGDWVSLSKKYAGQHAESNLDKGAKVYSKIVKSKDLRWAMDDVNEFGYYPESFKSQLLDIYKKAHGK